MSKLQADGKARVETQVWRQTGSYDFVRAAQDEVLAAADAIVVLSLAMTEHRPQAFVTRTPQFLRAIYSGLAPSFPSRS